MLVTCAKNVGHCLDTWLEYHKDIGVTNFQIINHEPHADDTVKVLSTFRDRYPETPNILEVTSFTGPFDQCEWSRQVTNSVLSRNAKDESLVIFFNDTDEYISANNGGRGPQSVIPFCSQVIDSLERLPIAEGTVRASSFTVPQHVIIPQTLDGSHNWRHDVWGALAPVHCGKTSLFVAAGDSKKITLTGWGPHRWWANLHVHSNTPPIDWSSKSICIDPILWPEVFPYVQCHHCFFGPSFKLASILDYSLTPAFRNGQIRRFGKRFGVQENDPNWETWLEVNIDRVYCQTVRAWAAKGLRKFEHLRTWSGGGDENDCSAEVEVKFLRDLCGAPDNSSKSSATFLKPSEAWEKGKFLAINPLSSS